MDAARRWGTVTMAALVMAGLTGCNKTTEPEGSSGPRPASSSPAPAPTLTAAARPSGPSDVTWDAPPGWTKSDKPNRMRKATYTIPRAAGDPEDGELTVSQAGGTVEQNIARWVLQLDRKLPDAKKSERTINGLKVTVVEIHGDYTPMAMPGAPREGKKPGFALLGAIVETSPPTFFKLVGPEKTAAAAQRDFDKLVESLHAK